jgi:RNA polymerase sigma-70 factor (ECF subfamily)
MTQKEINQLFLDYRDRGSDESFTKLYLYFKVNLIPSLFRFTQNNELTHDLFHKTWIKIIQKPDSFNAESGNFLSYFYTILRNDLTKYKIRESIFEEFEPDTDIAENLVIDEYKNLEHLFLEIPENFRDVLLLHYYYDVELKEIGRILGVADNTIKTRLFRGKKALKDILKNESIYY